MCGWLAMRFAAAVTAVRTRAEWHFPRPFFAPATFSMAPAKLPRCGGRHDPGEVPRLNGSSAILFSWPRVHHFTRSFRTRRMGLEGRATIDLPSLKAISVAGPLAA
jgi:hypothetical protein